MIKSVSFKIQAFAVSLKENATCIGRLLSVNLDFAVFNSVYWEFNEFIHFIAAVSELSAKNSWQWDNQSWCQKSQLLDKSCIFMTLLIFWFSYVPAAFDLLLLLYH